MRMVFAFLILTAFISIQFSYPQKDRRNEPTDQEQIDAVIKQFFDAIHLQDTSALKQIMREGGQFHAYIDSPAGKRIVKSTHAEWLKTIANPNIEIMERYWNVDKRIRKGIATVWTDYDFYVNYKFSHCGSNAFSLVKEKEHWYIADAVFTVEFDCEKSPLGPYEKP